MPSIDDEFDSLERTVRQDLELFVDRHSYVREFGGALHQVPPDGQIIFFHGVGGAGKSLLLRYLREHSCKMLPASVWRDLRDQPDEHFRTLFHAAIGIQVPLLFLDFSAPPDKAYGDPQLGFDGVLMLRRMLGDLGFSFPTFDFAVVTYGHRRGYPKEKIAEYLPAGQANLVGDLLKVLMTESRLGSLAVTAYEHLSAYLDADARRWWQKRKVPSEPLAQILLLDAETELIRHLPVFLAQDINDELERRAGKQELSKLCLFFDTHDAFWAERSFGEPAAQYTERDEWLRRLLRKLDLKRVLVVFTGRDRPAWATAEHAPIPERFVRTVAVGDLSPDDADLYLVQRHIHDPRRRRQVLASLRSESGIHPLSLGLVADVLERAGNASDVGDQLDDLFDGADRSFAAVGPKLLERLLRYLSADERYAVSALGACRSFDEDLFVELGAALRFHATHPALVRLTKLSFVLTVRADDGRPRWKLHTLLRRVLRGSSDDIVQRAHAFLAQHYRRGSSESGDLAHIEYLFHASRVTGSEREAAEEWLSALQEASEDVDNHRVLRLLGLQDELELVGWNEGARLAVARVSRYSSEGRFRDAAKLLRRVAGDAGEPTASATCCSSRNSCFSSAGC